MKFAIFSDIHSNLEALQAVLRDMYDQGATHYICLGDVVGYNASPKECLKVVRTLGCPVLMGNHDEMVANPKGDPRHFNVLAGEGISHSKKQLDKEEKEWLARLPFYQVIEGFTVVHASMDDPSNWNYVTSPLEAESNFTYQRTPVCFCGHTHFARVFMKSGRDVVELPKSEKLEIQKNQRYLVNVGGVGQPRDRDWRASYVLYDLEKQTLYFRRLEYDLATAQRRILDSGLPEPLAARLALGA